jgi:hypothetical protein
VGEYRRSAGRRAGDIAVAADVLSFSTTLTIAVARGCTCLVYSPAEIDQLRATPPADGVCADA